VDKFKIDVGTGYFVEKDQAEAIAFFNKRIDKLSGDAIKLKQLITEKVSLLQAIDSTIREKIIAANASGAAKSNAPASA
jgi:prefoldin alpha subunit